jgi:hypothetical protein
VTPSGKEVLCSAILLLVISGSDISKFKKWYEPSRVRRIFISADIVVHDLILYFYDYITKSCRQQAEVIKNNENENVRYIGQGEA